MVNTKKAISPVVATALLLVVAVVAVVGFQTWFNTYQSGQLADVEQKSAAGASITVERLENGTVYIKNVGSTNIDASSIAVSGCTDPGATTLNASTVSTITLAGCSLTTGTTVDVVVVSSDGVFPETEIVR